MKTLTSPVSEQTLGGVGKQGQVKKVTILAAAGALAACGALIPIPAGATQGHDKPWICHPVEGKGETGYGWNLINPDEASKHIDEKTGAGKHTRKDGRTDVYAVDGVCPGAPVPTETQEPTPSTTTPTTSTASPTLTSEPSSSVTEPGPTSTPSASESKPPSGPTGTPSSSPVTGPTHPTQTKSVSSESPSPRGTTSSPRKPVSEWSPTPSASRQSAPSASVHVLASTGAKTTAAVVGLCLLLAGAGLLAYRRRYLRQH